MRTARQLLKEFWLPLSLAVGWTVWRLSTHVSREFSLADVIATFGPAFFLISWATGQIVRVRKQARVEESFQTVERRLLEVAERLESGSRDIINQITGGDSFCYLDFYSDGSLRIMAVHVGDQPLYGVQARAVDIAKFNEAMSNGTDPFAADYHLDLKDFPPQVARPVASPLSTAPWLKLNVFFSARNGFWTQTSRRTGASLGAAIATRVVRERDGQSETIFEKVHPGYPRRDDGEVDWS